MLASVLIEYSVKSLNKVFDYIIPSSITNLRVGHKVMVPFASKEVEGFVLNIHNNKDESIEYREIIRIVESDFYLNEELLKLGKIMSKSLVCNLISCYQAMLPKALKASLKTTINRKYERVIYLNKEVDIDSYIELHKRNSSEINILEELKISECNRSKFNSSTVNKLLTKGLICEEINELYRETKILESKKKKIELTENQQNAYNDIINSSFDKFLLYGVTGSGKTEIYIKLIETMLKENKTCIVLVPEISLTPQIVARFKSVFKNNVAIFHSALSEGEKYDEYRKILRGEISVVVGARSAVFMPLKNIGLIIVDECQSATYKQENTPKYNAIDIAFERSKYNNAKVIMGSATPTLEQFARAKKGVYKLIELTTRISGKFPEIELVDMEIEAKKHNYIISSRLDKEITSALKRNEQVIILLNRRGYSTFLSCTNCGYVYKCPNCDISLIYHKSSSSYSCHYCGYRVESSNVCPKCHENAIKDLGLGTEKLESILKEKYNTSVLRMDADTTSHKNAHQVLINDFASKKYNILVGTQMISKGLNFENVTVVGIINADASLSIPDFRSAERTYELLSQTSGRVGRFDLPGKVLIQTYNMDNYVYASVIKNDYEDFYNKEMDIRMKLKYPPYFYICNVEVISKDYEYAGKSANTIKKYLDQKLNDKFIILGPSMAGIFRINNMYHFVIMIKYKTKDNLIDILNEINDNYTSNKLKLDISINI